LERDIAGLHEAETLAGLRRNIGRVSELALLPLEVSDLMAQRGFGRSQLLHLGALRKVGAYRPGDGQRQHADNRRQDRRPARRKAQPLIGSLLDRFGDRPLDGFDDMLMQRPRGVAAAVR